MNRSIYPLQPEPKGNELKASGDVWVSEFWGWMKEVAPKYGEEVRSFIFIFFPTLFGTSFIRLWEKLKKKPDRFALYKLRIKRIPRRTNRLRLFLIDFYYHNLEMT